MNFEWSEISQSGLALCCLPIFFLAPGYVAASLLNLFAFRNQGWIERLLWAASLSLPLALIFSVHPGIGIAPAHTTACFLSITVVAVGLAVLDWQRDGPVHRLCWSSEATWACIAGVVLLVYCLFASAPISIRGSLYESAIWQDWNVRLQLVNAAIRGGNRPGNPMFAPDGHPAPLHYYYFFYVLCARMHDVVPVDARALLTASCAGVALSLEAFLLLSVKYLGDKTVPLRRQAVATLLGACILGLDLIPSLVALSVHRMYSNLQFWLDDRSPGWLHMVLWSPHHVAGVVCCGLGTLLLIRSSEVSRRQQIAHSVLAGLCFAASVGTSTFITLLFVFGNFVLFTDAFSRKQWKFIQAALLSTAIAVVASLSFLRGLLQAQPTSSATSGRPLIFWPRYAHQALVFVWAIVREYYKVVLHRAVLIPVPGHFVWTERLLRPPVALCMFFLDFGFFVFVLVYQVRKDLFASEAMSQQARTLWLLFAGIAIPGCLLNSAALQSNNDFGRHAALCLHYVLLLWSAPLVATFFERGRQWKDRSSIPLFPMAKVAVACASLGLLGQAAQIILDRVHMPLSASGLIPQQVVAERVPRLGFRFAQIQQAMAFAARITPKNGIVQSNPHSRLQPIFLLYTNRQMAASDDGCNTPFGGDPKACTAIARGLIELFGGSGPHFHGNSRVFKPPLPFDPALVTVSNFTQVCSSLKLNAIAASYVDPAWRDPASWVWQLDPAFSNSTVRVFACPAGSQKFP